MPGEISVIFSRNRVQICYDVVNSRLQIRGRLLARYYEESLVIQDRSPADGLGPLSGSLHGRPFDDAAQQYHDDACLVARLRQCVFDRVDVRLELVVPQRRDGGVALELVEADVEARNELLVLPQPRALHQAIWIERGLGAQGRVGRVEDRRRLCRLHAVWHASLPTRQVEGLEHFGQTRGSRGILGTTHLPCQRICTEIYVSWKDRRHSMAAWRHQSSQSSGGALLLPSSQGTAARTAPVFPAHYHRSERPSPAPRPPGEGCCVPSCRPGTCPLWTMVAPVVEGLLCQVGLMTTQPLNVDLLLTKDAKSVTDSLVPGL